MLHLDKPKTGLPLESNRFEPTRCRRALVTRGDKSREYEPGDVSGACEVSRPAAWLGTFRALNLQRVLVPFDFSRGSVRLLQWMTSVAEGTKIKISILHVVYPWWSATGREAPCQADFNQERVQAARSLFHRLLGKTCRWPDGFSVHVVMGRPADEIARFAGWLRADLIVMVTHRNRRFNCWPRSTTTEQTNRRAPCPVLAVPEALLARPEVTNPI